MYKGRCQILPKVGFDYLTTVWVAIIGSIATVSSRDVQDQSAWILLQFLVAQKYLWVEMIIGFFYAVIDMSIWWFKTLIFQHLAILFSNKTDFPHIYY